MFNIDYHEKEILAVCYKDKKNQTEEKQDQLNLMDIQYLLGSNHRLPLSHMAKSYIWLEETNQLITEFSVGYMIDSSFSLNKYFKEQVKVCMRNIFSTSTMTHMSKILLKPNTRVL